MLTAASLFAGIGGFDKALEGAGVEVVLQAEIDPSAQTVLRANFPNTTLIPDATQADLRGVDLVTAGFPCQGLSNAALTRKHSGLFDPNSLSHVVWAALERVFAANPEYLLLENADALSTARYAKDLQALLDGLAQNGYFAKLVHLNAGCYGSNMRRARTFILGRRRAWSIQDVPNQVAWENPLQAAGAAAQLGGAVFEAQPSVTKKAASYTLMVTADEVRSVSPEGVEYLLGFPVGWTNSAGSTAQRYQRLGNAVSVDCARAALGLLLGHPTQTRLPEYPYHALYDFTRPAGGGAAASCVSRIVRAIEAGANLKNQIELIYLLPVYRRWVRQHGGLTPKMKDYLAKADRLIPSRPPTAWPDFATVVMRQRGVMG